MTITADVPAIESVVRTSSPSAGGFYRDVWFFGDLVIKRNNEEGECEETCETEYNNYLNFDDFTFERDGETFHVKFPETTMIGEYLIMKKIDFPFLQDPYSEDNCPDRPAGKVNCDYMQHYGTHRHGMLTRWVEHEVGERYGISDMHNGNFKFDFDTNTFWILDFAQ